MPVSPKSLANLRPAWTSATVPRGKGWPAWRRNLQAVVGDGRELFEMLGRFARAEAVPVVGPDGTPLRDPETGRQVILVPKPAIVIAAIRELLDRAFGKPVPAIVDGRADEDASRASDALGLDDLTDEEKATLRAIARRRMLGAAPARPSGK